MRNEQVDYWSSSLERVRHKLKKEGQYSDIDFSTSKGGNYYWPEYGIDIKYALPDSIEVWNKQKGFIMWDFNKLDIDGAKKAKEAFEKTDYKALMDIHNEYQLSNENYTCNCQARLVYDWWSYGFKYELIVLQNEKTTS